MSSDGYALTSAGWEENAHNIDVYNQAGWPGGMATGDAGNGGDGTFGLAMDANHIYTANGNGDVYRLSRSLWQHTTNYHSYDPGVAGQPGSSATVGPLVVDAGGNPLLGETLCDGNLYVTDSGVPFSGTGLSPASTTIAEVPTDLSGVTTCWAAPNASVLTCDRER